MIQTVIGINSAMMRMPDKKRKQMDYKKELQGIINQVESAKNHLAEVTEAMDFDDREVDSLDEALDALEADHDYLTAGGVFPEELIRNFIKTKREECRQIANIPHPAEFERYYNL